ncbi:MAG: PIN domain-containing protein [Methanosarcinales archaeon]|jgi:predicted nucleic acid-binding protein|nr:MAG: PIN domain-containing protein [Methanosarcinales archaeon]
MKPRVFLDTNIFIYAFEFQESNSRKMLSLLNQGVIEGIISERVLIEVQRYFKAFHNKDLAGLFRSYLLATCTVIPSAQIAGEIGKYRGQIKEKDLEQLVVTKWLGLKFLVAYDRDFENCTEYRTPRQFLTEFGIEVAKTDF